MKNPLVMYAEWLDGDKLAWLAFIIVLVIFFTVTFALLGIETLAVILAITLVYLLIAFMLTLMIIAIFGD